MKIDFYKGTQIIGRVLCVFALVLVIYCGLRMLDCFKPFFEAYIQKGDHNFIIAILTGFNVIVLSLTLIEIVGGINYRKLLNSEKIKTEKRLDELKNELYKIVDEKDDKKLIDWSNKLIWHIDSVDKSFLNKKDRKSVLLKIDYLIAGFLKHISKEIEYYAEYYLHNFPSLIENKEKSEEKRKYIKRKYKI